MRQFGLIDMFVWTALYAAWFAVWPWSGTGPWIVVVWSLLLTGTIVVFKVWGRPTAAIFAVFSVGFAIGIYTFFFLDPGTVNVLSISDLVIMAGGMAAVSGATLGIMLWLSVSITNRIIATIKRKLAPAPNI